MGTYSVPEEIRKLKPKGTSVKPIKGNYYVYTHSQSKDSMTGKWKTDTGKLIGRIVPGVDFCPREEVLREERITCFDYGKYLLGCRHAKADFELLKEIFNPDEAMMLISLAIIFAILGYVALKDAERIYERSLVARDYPALGFSYRKISVLLELIGRTEKAKVFQKKCFESADAVAIEGHVIPGRSEENDLVAAGYKTKSIESEYMNLMVALDVDTGEPVSTRVFPGDTVDKSVFADFLETCGSTGNKLILVDMGFFSAENIGHIERNGGNYIVPVSENRKEYAECTKATGGRKASFIYHGKGRNDIVEYRDVFSQ